MAENQIPENQTPEHQNPDSQPKQSEDVISDYYDGVKQMEMEGYESGIRKARNALFVAAGIVLAWELIGLAIAKIPLSYLPTFYWVILFAVVGSFIALALWTKTKPYTAIVVGLILYILLWIATVALTDGSAVYKGIVVRIIIIAVLISALKPAKAWEDLKKSR